MAKIDFKILKNMPEFDSYGQYHHDDNLQLFFESTGIKTPYRFDDLYTVIENVGGYLGASASKDWRPIANVYSGNINQPEEGIYLQKYYAYEDLDYEKTAPPLYAFLYFEMAYNDNSYDINYYEDGSTFQDTLQAGEKIYAKIINWDWKEGDGPLNTSDVARYASFENFGEVYNSDGTPRIFQHLYETPGMKKIKVAVYTKTITDAHHFNFLEIRINVGLDGIFIEDFTDLGGPDFTTLPWPNTSPVIGGISKKSKYYKSLRNIFNSGKFSDKESFDRYSVQKAYLNTELGESLGDCDIQQVRLFKSGEYDMSYLLGIRNKLTVTGEQFFAFDDIYDIDSNPNGYWDGQSAATKYSDETSIGILFINDVLDADLMYDCIFEINPSEIIVSSILDSVGNGNKGILIGDYKLTKDSHDIPVVRDSVMEISKIKYEDGAF